jgi:uncharacterized protein YdeI (YjbR/CyaY-like superfamily)
MAMKITNLLNVETRQELQNWLSANAEIEKEAWVYCEVKSDDQKLLYLDVVEEAICFGWIDSTKKKIDGRVAQRISPRSKRSNWTELNKERARRLEKLGLMTDLGKAILPDMRPESFVVASEVLEALQADEIVWENYLVLPDLYKRIRIDNIQSYLKIKDGHDVYNNRLQKFLDNTRMGKLYGEWSDGGKLLDY